MQQIVMTYGVMKEYHVWDCPSCGANTINVLHFPHSVSIRQSKTASLPGSKGFHTNPDVYVIKGGCTKCGKSNEEVEEMLKREGMLK